MQSHVHDGCKEVIVGQTTMIVGPMFSGKTDELVKQLERLKYGKKNFLLFKSKIDTRSSTGLVYSRDGRALAAIEIDALTEVYPVVKQQVNFVNTVAFDEVNFFPKEIVNLVIELNNAGHDVLAAGLSTNFRGEPFNAVGDLLAIADQIIKLNAYCDKCFVHNASLNQRLVNQQPASYDDPLIVVGHKESYAAYCKQCFRIRHRPKKFLP